MLAWISWWRGYFGVDMLVAWICWRGYFGGVDILAWIFWWCGKTWRGKSNKPGVRNTICPLQLGREKGPWREQIKIKHQILRCFQLHSGAPGNTHVSHTKFTRKSTPAVTWSRTPNFDVSHTCPGATQLSTPPCDNPIARPHPPSHTQPA